MGGVILQTTDHPMVEVLLNLASHYWPRLLLAIMSLRSSTDGVG